MDGGIAIQAAAEQEEHLAGYTSFLKRYWEINAIGISDFTANLSFTYKDEDVVGFETALIGVNLDNNFAITGFEGVDADNNIVSISGISNFGRFTATSGF